MLFEGCQGKKHIRIQEKECPNCGKTAEIMSSDVYILCEECGEPIFSDLVACSLRCPNARDCVGEAAYERLCEARQLWREQQEQLNDEDEW